MPTLFSVGPTMSSHKCTRYDDKTARKGVTSAMEKRKRVSNRMTQEMKEYYWYMHYRDRYVEHKESLKLGAALRAQVNKRIAASEKKGISNDFS